MKLFYEIERDKGLEEACEQVRKERPGYIPVREIARMAIARQAPSFYISRKEIKRIVKKTREGIRPAFASRSRNELYNEIASRAGTIEKTAPGIPAGKVADIIMSQTAPRFYISEARAVDVYYGILNRKKRP